MKKLILISSFVVLTAIIATNVYAHDSLYIPNGIKTEVMLGQNKQLAKFKSGKITPKELLNILKNSNLNQDKTIAKLIKGLRTKKPDFDINYQGKNYKTALYIAARKGMTHTVYQLLQFPKINPAITSITSMVNYKFLYVHDDYPIFTYWAELNKQVYPVQVFGINIVKPSKTFLVVQKILFRMTENKIFKKGGRLNIFEKLRPYGKNQYGTPSARFALARKNYLVRKCGMFGLHPNAYSIRNWRPSDSGVKNPFKKDTNFTNTIKYFNQKQYIPKKLLSLTPFTCFGKIVNK